MNRKRVLVLEDDLLQRNTLQDGLNNRGLDADAAASAAEAWSLLEDGRDLDVAILDINLLHGAEDRAGLEFGMQLRKSRESWPPEFLILSALESPDYFQMALALGAAAYLKKATVDSAPLPRAEVIAQHTRALALRRALHGERPGMSERLELIAESSRSRADAIERFCRDVLYAELKAIGDHFLLLLTHGGQTMSFADGSLGELSPIVLDRIQSAVHARLGAAGPLVLTENVPWLTPEQRQATKHIRGATFIEIGEAEPFRLCLGLVPNGQVSASIEHQVKLLDVYLQRPVIRHLLEITDRWSKQELKYKLKNQRRQVLLEATSDFCFYQGQELESELHAVEKKLGGPERSEALSKLRAIASELHDAGELLTQFVEPDTSGPAPAQVEVEMNALVRQVWKEEVSIALRLADREVLQFPGGQCVAAERKERATRTVAQVLTWLGRRLLRSQPEEGAPELFVDCRPCPERGRVQIFFEERHSRRLPSHLRRALFKPFAGASRESSDRGKRLGLGLYLAYLLAELAGGTLFEDSDRMSGPLGHRLVLELPAIAPAASW